MTKNERDEIAQAIVCALADEHEYAMLRSSGRWSTREVAKAKAHSDASQRRVFDLLYAVLLDADEPSEPPLIIHSVSPST